MGLFIAYGVDAWKGYCYYYFAISNDNVSFGTCFLVAVSDCESLTHKKSPSIEGLFIAVIQVVFHRISLAICLTCISPQADNQRDHLPHRKLSCHILFAYLYLTFPALNELYCASHANPASLALSA